ncbi:MAG: RiPP maturation radical SAM C-methyltransferase [Bacteroidota bacterium]|nr:RiPP maturation radical SAM C-methyltransferase [Bacteroidota bacterium]MDP4233554.1 RiPP maturation radical SAM C-methyltransferase [Bacteroidota bacterium]MDP4243671.1 RiPP maturation radical SAM C-methyltransferase [Bacteroidota bacterium]MDP4287740.1 RiPP maturation radical SAM C-methyltransferase [Bacteroidota bacterium]
MGEVDVVLVSMPWGPVSQPSLGLGVLKACLNQNGIRGKVFHASPRLLRWVSLATYEFLAGCWGINEFLFSGALDPECDEVQIKRLVEQAEKYVEEKRNIKYGTAEEMVDLFFGVRHEVVPAFLSLCAERILASSPAMVGFTCMFDQTIASIALAKILKQIQPDLTIVLGGYALEGRSATTVAASFDWLDAIVTGDGEKAVVDIAQAVLRGREELDCLLLQHGEPAGTVGHDGESSAIMPLEMLHAPLLAAAATKTSPRRIVLRAPKIDLAESPVPDYSDWFDDLEDIQQVDQIRIASKILPVESSRGCWWGQVKHCMFCGIDDETLKYRFKPPQQILSMLEEMRNMYGSHSFHFSDYIMPKRYYTELLPLLAQHRPKFDLKGEMKANHPPERVRLLTEAGFTEVQPGIESFSTKVLQAMNKGVRAIDNVSLLRASYINRLVVDYNLLYGLPNDSVEDYFEMAERIPRLYHLTPPVARTYTVVTRFAPLQVSPGKFGIMTQAKHHPCYDTVFSQAYLAESGLSLDDYAYYFDRNFEYSPELRTIYKQIVFQVEHWKSLHRSRFVELSHSVHDGRVHIVDSRFSEVRQYELDEPTSFVFLACESAPTHVEKVFDRISASFGSTSRQFDEYLSELDEKRIVWKEGGSILALPLPKEVCTAHKESEWTKSWLSLFV